MLRVQSHFFNCTFSPKNCRFFAFLGSNLQYLNCRTKFAKKESLGTIFIKHIKRWKAWESYVIWMYDQRDLIEKWKRRKSKTNRRTNPHCFLELELCSSIQSFSKSFLNLQIHMMHLDIRQSPLNLYVYHDLFPII